MQKVHARGVRITLLASVLAGCGSSTNSSTGTGGGAAGGLMNKGGSVGSGGAANGGATGAGGSFKNDGGIASGGARGGSGGAAGSRSADGAVTDGRATPGTGGIRATGGARADAGSASATGGAVADAGPDTSIGAGGNVGAPNVIVDPGARYQTMEGFGFFGAQDSWWGKADDMWSDDWGDLVIKDLGITMWRNEYYSEESRQDASWAKQKPVVQGLKRVADANRVPLKFLLTVWSPPSSMKCTTASVQAGDDPCTANPDGLKNGGTLDPSKYAAFAEWLNQGIQNYADVGVDLYGISPQNEPKFVEFYNSCEYDVDPGKRNSYAKMIEAVAPLVKKAYPKVKVYGTENMLGLEGQPWFYCGSFASTTWSKFDALAYHGYQDGVAPTAGSQLATYWAYVRDNWAIPNNKPSWMTETSGYTDVWDDAKGAKALGFAIYAALSYGHASAWVWWQGSELGGPPSEFALMDGIENLSKRYYVSKNFYRFIRPGAVMVGIKNEDPDLFVVGFVHPTMNATTLVAINNSSKDKPLVLGGDGIPSTYDTYRTSATENCVAAGSVANGGIVLRANSITTLVSGKFIE